METLLISGSTEAPGGNSSQVNPTEVGQGPGVSLVLEFFAPEGQPRLPVATTILVSNAAAPQIEPGTPFITYCGT